MNPTDEELAEWYAGHFGAPVYDGQACDDMRAAIAAPTREEAVKVLAEREWCSAYGTNLDPLREAVRSLRKRFPRPIDGAVLRACGFGPPREGAEFWRSGDGIAAIKALAHGRGTWIVSPVYGSVFFRASTADRFADVCEALWILYGEEG